MIDSPNNFKVVINGEPIFPEERNLQALLDKDAAENPYLWTYDQCPVCADTDWTVSGWIGALDRTKPPDEGGDYGITRMTRGKYRSGTLRVRRGRRLTVRALLLGWGAACRLCGCRGRHHLHLVEFPWQTKQGHLAYCRRPESPPVSFA